MEKNQREHFLKKWKKNIREPDTALTSIEKAIDLIINSLTLSKL